MKAREGGREEGGQHEAGVAGEQQGAGTREAHSMRGPSKERKEEESDGIKLARIGGLRGGSQEERSSGSVGA